MGDSQKQKVINIQLVVLAKLNARSSVFGEDADTYRPERWLEDPERAKLMDRYIFTFGQGARTCIGKVI